MATSDVDKTILESAMLKHHCQTFPEGCVGCCVNMRWSDLKIKQYLSDNTKLAAVFLPAGKRPSYWQIVRLYFHRGAWLDLLLTGLLVIPTAGISAILWKRYHGSCPFAGYLDAEKKRAGCLLHPQRLGLPDSRKHAFPLLPLVKCNRQLRCPALDRPDMNWTLSLLTASRTCYASLRSRPKLVKIKDTWRNLLKTLHLLPQAENGAVLMEYIVLMMGVLFTLLAAQTLLFNVQGAVHGDLGALGNAFQRFYQNLIMGLSMPIP